MSVHQIRLAGPWEWHLIQEPDGQESEAAVSSERKPCELPFGLKIPVPRQSVALFRRFHCPTGIDDSTTVAIVLALQGAAAEVLINRIAAPNLPGRHSESSDGVDATTLRFDISRLLKPFNELQVLIRPTATAAGTGGVLISACLEMQE